MENLYRFGRVTIVYHAGNLDFRGTDHMNIDALVPQRLKHPSSDSSMVTHAHPDDRYLGNILITGDIQISPFFFHPLQDTNSRLTIQPGNGKAQVGQACVAGAALNDHIYHDAF